MNPSIMVALITAAAGAVVAVVSAVFTAAQNRRTRLSQRELEEYKSRLTALERVEQRRHEDERTLDRYREPLLLAAHDLGDRIDNVRMRGLMGLMGISDRRDALIVRGTAFRVAQYFAMVELLYPQLGSTLAKGDAETKEVARLLRRIGRTFASDTIDQAGTDGARFMLWREEQRAIGELMLAEPTASQLPCLGYAAFLDRYDRDFAPWLAAFVEDLQSPGASKSVRLAELQVLFADLVQRLDARGAFVRVDDMKHVIGPQWIINVGLK